MNDINEALARIGAPYVEAPATSENCGSLFTRREPASPAWVERRGQRGLARERSSRIELRYVALGREGSGLRSASSRAHRRKRGDLVAWPLLPCFRLPIPPRPCCIDRAYSTATAGRSQVSANSDGGR